MDIKGLKMELLKVLLIVMVIGGFVWGVVRFVSYLGGYAVPFFTKTYKVSMKQYDGQRKDYQCWYNKDLGVMNYKEYDVTYTMFKEGEVNGYFTRSWEPLDKVTAKYFDSGTI